MASSDHVGAQPSAGKARCGGGGCSNNKQLGVQVHGRNSNEACGVEWGYLSRVSGFRELEFSARVLT